MKFMILLTFRTFFFLCGIQNIVKMYFFLVSLSLFYLRLNCISLWCRLFEYNSIVQFGVCLFPVVELNSMNIRCIFTSFCFDWDFYRIWIWIKFSGTHSDELLEILLNELPVSSLNPLMKCFVFISSEYWASFGSDHFHIRTKTFSKKKKSLPKPLFRWGFNPQKEWNRLQNVLVSLQSL